MASDKKPLLKQDGSARYVHTLDRNGSKRYELSEDAKQEYSEGTYTEPVHKTGSSKLTLSDFKPDTELMMATSLVAVP